MNGHAEYRRDSHRPADRPDLSPDADPAVSRLARHRDPSLASAPTPPPDRSKRIAWVRPTELAGFASPVIGRGIDLQAELLRRARRTPAIATRAVRRSAHHSLHPPEPPAPRQEGLEL